MPAINNTDSDLDLDLDEEGDTSSCHDDHILSAHNESIGHYLAEIGRYPLLTAEQERDLGRAIQQGETELRRAQATGTVPDAYLLEAAHHARQRMIESNLRLVVSIAKLYMHGDTMPLLDLIQEGNLGLMKAVNRYDPDRGLRFSTYATWWIRQAIGRAVAENGMIRLPVHINEAIARMKRAVIQLANELGREPTVAEIAQALKVTPEKVLDLRLHMEQVYSLNAPLLEMEETVTLEDMLEDKTQQLEAMVADNQQIVQMLSHLPARERAIIEMRYGLRGRQSLTLEEIAHSFHLTRERIRQLEVRALQMLRQFNCVEQLRSLQ